MAEEPGGGESMGLHRVRHHKVTNAFTFKSVIPLLTKEDPKSNMRFAALKTALAVRKYMVVPKASTSHCCCCCC